MVNAIFFGNNNNIYFYVKDSALYRTPKKLGAIPVSVICRLSMSFHIMKEKEGTKYKRH